MLSVLELSSSNTGQIQGDVSKGVIRSILIGGGKIAAAGIVDAATTQATLAALSKKARSDSDKLYVLPEVQNFEDRSEQDTTGALNLGVTLVLKEGKPAYEIRMDGTSEFAKALRKWNGKTVPVWEIDANKKMWGRISGTDMYGYTAKVKTSYQKIASGQAVEEGIVIATISFLSSTEYGDQSKAIDLADVDTSLMKAQNDARLVFVSKASNVHKFKLEIPLGIAGKVYDVCAKFKDAIDAASATIFEAGTGSSYATALTIDSAEVGVDGLLAITFDETEYTALGAATNIEVRGKSPAVLEAANITDMEFVSVVTVK